MADELDYKLLVSCLSGVGRWREEGTKKSVAVDPKHWRAHRQGKKLAFEKTDDCVGATLASARPFRGGATISLVL